jgi:HEAT repeat protein
MRPILAALLLCLAAATCSAERSPVKLNEHTRLGQRFTSKLPVADVYVSMPSWSDNEGGLTLTLWDSPARGRSLARRVLTGVRDNEMVAVRLTRSLPAGSYYWEISDRTGLTAIGLYCDDLPADTVDCAYTDGAPNPRRAFLFEVATSLTPMKREALLIADLAPGKPRAVREQACRGLARVGSAACVPALSRMLDDADLAHMARFAMEGLPSPAVDAAFRAALARLSGPRLVGVINSVGVRRDNAAVPRLAQLLKAGDAAVAAAAAAALGRVGSLEAASALTRAWTWAPAALRPSVAEASLECAAGLMAAGNAAAAAPLYDRLCALGSPRQFRAGAARGSILCRGKQAAARLVALLRGSDDDLRDGALWAARHDLPGAETTRALTSALAGLPEATQLRLLEVLAGRGDVAAMPALRACAAVASTPMRVAAAGAIARVGGASEAVALVALMDDKASEVRQAAQEALASLPGREVAAAAAKLLTHAQPARRADGAALAQRLKLTALAPALAGALRDPSATVRTAAARALSELGNPEQAPALCAALAAGSGGPDCDAIEQALTAIAARAGDLEAAAAPAADALSQATPSGRASLLRVLGSIGSGRALQAVRATLAGPDPAARAAAADVLCSWPGEAAAPDMLTLVQGAGSPAERTKALRGILRLAGAAELPADRRLALCAQAAPLIQRDPERQMLLSALAGIAAWPALELALPLLESPGVKEEACATVTAIAAGLADGPGSAKLTQPLARVIAASPAQATAEKARALVEKVRQYR